MTDLDIDMQRYYATLKCKHCGKMEEWEIDPDAISYDFTETSMQEKYENDGWWYEIGYGNVCPLCQKERIHVESVTRQTRKGTQTRIGE